MQATIAWHNFSYSVLNMFAFSPEFPIRQKTFSFILQCGVV